MQCTTEGSLEVKLPTIWTDGKAEVGRVRQEKKRRKKIREEKESVRRQNMINALYVYIYRVEGS
jgi:hypothetical protein